MKFNDDNMALQVVKLLQALARLRAAGRFQLFENVPDPDQSWPSSDGHGYLVYNKVVPLPLALETLQVSWGFITFHGMPEVP
jgi:hypothetical protein